MIENALEDGYDSDGSDVSVGYGRDDRDAVEVIVAELREAFCQTKTHMISVADAVADEWARCAQGSAFRYAQVCAVALVLDCAVLDCACAAKPTNGQPETDTAKLRAAIIAKLSAEWAKVQTAAVELRARPSVLGLTAAGDVEALRAHLDRLVASAGDLSEASQLREELLEVCAMGTTPLILAVDLDNTQCVTALLDVAAAAGHDTLHAMLSAKGVGHYNATALSVAVTSERREALMALMRAGADLRAPMTDPMAKDGPPASALEMLTREALRGPGECWAMFKDALAHLMKNTNFYADCAVTRQTRRPRRGGSESRGDDGRDGSRSGDDGGDGSGSGEGGRNGSESGDDGRDDDGTDDDGSSSATSYATWPVYGRCSYSMKNMSHMSEAYTIDRMEGQSMISMAVGASGDMRVEVIKALLAAGATVGSWHVDVALEKLSEPRRKKGRVFRLWEAAQLAVLEALLDGVDAVGDASTRDEIKRRAMDYVVELNLLSAAKAILARGVDTGAPARPFPSHLDTLLEGEQDEQTLLQWAEHKGNPKMVDIIRQYDRMRRLDRGGGGSAGRRQAAAADEAGGTPDLSQCVICCAAPKKIIIAPCGHKCVCVACTKTLLGRPVRERNCPLCRERLESFVITVFDD